MELSSEDAKIIAEALIRASDATETEWLKIEEAYLKSYPPPENEKAGMLMGENWNRLHRKIEGSINKRKKNR